MITFILLWTIFQFCFLLYPMEVKRLKCAVIGAFTVHQEFIIPVVELVQFIYAIYLSTGTTPCINNLIHTKEFIT